MMLNTGGEIVRSNNGLITTVLWQLGKDAEVAYALEGAVAVAGSGVRYWMRDKMGLFGDIPELEALANGVEDSGGVIFVPALSGGLLAPHWRGDAKGVIMGMTSGGDITTPDGTALLLTLQWPLTYFCVYANMETN